MAHMFMCLCVQVCHVNVNQEMRMLLALNASVNLKPHGEQVSMLKVKQFEPSLWDWEEKYKKLSDAERAMTSEALLVM